MAGTWLAIKSTWKLVLVGFVLSVIATVQSIYVWPLNIDLTYFPQDKIPYYGLLLFLISFLLYSMRWARKKIELLFHYRRVSELFAVVEAYSEAKKLQDRRPQSSATFTGPCGLLEMIQRK
jgi:hypothetical protein